MFLCEGTEVPIHWIEHAEIGGLFNFSFSSIYHDNHSPPE